MSKIELVPTEFKIMRSPTEEELNSELFNKIWNTIKSWDVNVPEHYSGYCGVNGSHVCLILDAINKELK
jgi:hypothetical protein